MAITLESRVVAEAEYVVKTGATVRKTAEVFEVGKSTVHNDLTKKLKYANATLYEEVKKILHKNLLERHLRGGEATKHKYKGRKKTSFTVATKK